MSRKKRKPKSPVLPPAATQTSARSTSLSPAALPRVTWVHLLILLSLSFAVYAPALRNGFVTDDKTQMLMNPNVKNPHNIPEAFSGDVWSFAQSSGSVYYKPSNYYRPFQLLTYMGEYFAFGERPWPWHLVNLVLNLAVVAAVYFLVRSLGGAELAFWSTLWFALQPMHVEAVVWVAALPDLLCGLFLIAAMLFYHRGRSGEHPKQFIAISVLLFISALFTKETALLFPAILLAYEYLYRRASLRQILRGFSWQAPYFAALAVYIIIRLLALGSFAPALQVNAARLTRSQLFLAIPPIILRYIGKLLVPVGMNYFYYLKPADTLGWVTVGAFILVLIVGAIVLLMRKDQPVLSFSLAWFFLTLIPTLNINTVGDNFFTERYLYIPSLGFSVLAASAWLWLRARARPEVGRWLIWGFAAVIFAFYIVQIERRIPAFHDNFALYSITVRQSPNAPVVLEGMAMAEYDRGDVDQAVAYESRSVALGPNREMARLKLAQYLTDKGRYDEAIAQLRQFMQVYPLYLGAWINLAKVYTDMKDWDQAADCYRRAAEIDPAAAGYYNQLIAATQAFKAHEPSGPNPISGANSDPENTAALVQVGDGQARLGQWKEAANTFRLASKEKPDDPQILNKLGVSLSEIGDLNGAISAYQRAIQLQPDFYLARLDLALSLARSKRTNDSVAQLKYILEKDPTWEHIDRVHGTLGILLEQEGDRSAAADEFRKALTLDPENVEARQHLQNLTGSAGKTH